MDEPMIAALAEQAAALDAADPLARWRDEFVVVDDELAYLDGNSLGMPPRLAIERVTATMSEGWAAGLISSWEGGWLRLPLDVGDRLAPIIGARPGEVVVHDSTSVNLYQLVRAALRLRPGAIAVSGDDFPTDRYVVGSIAAADGLEVRDGFDDLDGVGVVVRSMVDYRTAEIVDVATEAARADTAGALVVWDLSHAAGLLPVDVHGVGIRLAVGCTYKYLNGGPGAPAFTFVDRDLIAELDEPFHGWFANRLQFAMGPTFEPRDDVGRMMIGTPPILSLVAADAGIEVTAAAGIDAIRAKSIELGRFGLACCDALGLDTTTPRDDRRRGGHLCVRHPEARRITTEMAARHRVLADFREPDVVRLGCSPLTTRFGDVMRAIVAIAQLSA